MFSFVVYYSDHLDINYSDLPNGDTFHCAISNSLQCHIVQYKKNILVNITAGLIRKLASIRSYQVHGS